MAQFVAFEDGIEVHGNTVLSVVAGTGSFQSLAREILRDCGLPDVQPDAWYPQQSWLDAFRTLHEKVGSATLYAIGTKIPENAEFPPSIETIEQALQSIDVAYHMNHRQDGVVLFDAASGEMSEGIGHYGYEPKGDRCAEMACRNPYPCDFDRGIIVSMAKQFQPDDSVFVSVEHDESKPCRKQGADSCTYRVEW